MIISKKGSQLVHFWPGCNMSGVVADIDKLHRLESLPNCRGKFRVELRFVQ